MLEKSKGPELTNQCVIASPNDNYIMSCQFSSRRMYQRKRTHRPSLRR